MNDTEVKVTWRPDQKKFKKFRLNLLLSSSSSSESKSRGYVHFACVCCTICSNEFDGGKHRVSGHVEAVDSGFLCRTCHEASSSNKHYLRSSTVSHNPVLKKLKRSGRPRTLHQDITQPPELKHDYQKCFTLKCDKCAKICNSVTGCDMILRSSLDCRLPCSVKETITAWKEALALLDLRIQGGRKLMEELKMRHHQTLSVGVSSIDQQQPVHTTQHMEITIETLLSTCCRTDFVFTQSEERTVYEQLDVGILFLNLYNHGMNSATKTTKTTTNNTWDGPEVHLMHKERWLKIITTKTTDNNSAAVQLLKKKLKKQQMLIKNSIELCTRKQPNVQRPVVGLNIPGAPTVNCAGCQQSFSRLFYEQVEKNYKIDRTRILNIKSKKQKTKTVVAKHCLATNELESDHEAVEVLDNLHLERCRSDCTIEAWHCTSCRFELCHIDMLAAEVENQAALLAIKANIFTQPHAEPLINYHKRVDVPATEIGTLPDGTLLEVPPFSFYVWTVNESMYRDTSGLAMGTTTPFPGNLELIENYSLTRDDFVKHEIKIDGKGSKDGNSTIVVDGSNGMNVILWKGETDTCNLFDMQGCKPFNFIELLRELPWKVLATVDFSCDANLSNMSLRAQQTEDSKLAAANNETFINAEGSMDTTVTLTKRGGTAHGMIKKHKEFQQMEVVMQYNLAMHHVDMDVVALGRRYCNLLELMRNPKDWADTPLSQKRVPCVTEVTYPAGFNTSHATTRSGKPISHSQSPQQMSSRNSKQHLACQVVAEEAAWDHAVRSMTSRARMAIAMDYLGVHEGDIEIFEAYGNEKSRTAHAKSKHFHGIQACWQRLLSGTSRFEHHYNTTQCQPHNKAQSADVLLQKLRTLTSDASLDLVEKANILELVLVELKISSGQTSNYFSSFLHVDGNTTQSWETATSHWRGNRNPNSSPMFQAKMSGGGISGKVDCGALVVPCCQIIFMFSPHVATLHIHLVHVLHGSSPGRNEHSMVRLCGPRGFLEKRTMLTGGK